MVCHMKQSCFHTFVVVADKIIIRMGCHIRGRHFYVFISGNIHTGGIICLVVFSRCDREGGYRTFSVIHNSVNIRRKYRIGMVIHRNCRIRPPQESLWQICRIIQLTFDLNISLSRVQRNRRHSFGSIHFIRFSHIDRAGAIRILRQAVVYR